MRWVRRLLVAFVVPFLLVACAPSASVVVPSETDVPQGQVQAQSENVVVLLSDLHENFLRGPDSDARYVSTEATPALATAELNQAIGLGAQAQRFTLATATELTRMDGAGEYTDVEFEIRDLTVLGAEGDRVIVQTTVWQQFTPVQGPIFEQSVTYAVGWDGETLVSIEDVVRSGNERGLDGGTGLSSPLGAVDRFVDLVTERDFGAISQFSAGGNVNETTLEVLASVVDSSEAVYGVTLPQETEGSKYVVYLVNASDMVVGRFEVTLSQPTVVVFFPTN